MDWFWHNQESTVNFHDWLPWLVVCWLRSGNKIRDSVCNSVSAFLKTVFNISPWVSSSHWGSGSNVTQCSNEGSCLNLTHFLWPDMCAIESISGLHRPPSNSFSNLVQEFRKYLLTWFLQLKVAFIQKGLVNLSFLQTNEPNYFPELNFLHAF